MVTMHFHIAQMSSCLGTFFFLIEGAQENILAPMKIVIGVQGRSNKILWYRVPHFSANLRNCLPPGYSAAHIIFVYQPIFLRV